MTVLKKLFGARVKELRKGRGWTQEDLAERMNITPNYLSSIERGQKSPTFDMLIKLSDALKAEMWELFDFGHEAGPKELRGKLTKLAKEIEEDKLKLLIKVADAIVR